MNHISRVAACVTVMLMSGVVLSTVRQAQQKTMNLAASMSLTEATRSTKVVVEMPPDDALMPLYVTLQLDFDEEWIDQSGEVAVSYRAIRDWDMDDSLWTQKFEKPMNQSMLRIRLYRLRPNQRYSYEVFLAKENDSPQSAAHGTFISRGTGFERFDSGPYVAISGDRPSFALGTFAAYPSLVAQGQEKQWFQGLLAVDAQGYIVWLYSLCMLEAWDFLPDSSIILVARNDGSCSMLTDHDKGTPARTRLIDDNKQVVANSQLQKIGPDGTLLNQFIQECADGPLHFNKLSHECRVDPFSKNLQVLTTMYQPSIHPDLYATIKTGPTQSVVEHTDTFANAVIVAWDHTVSPDDRKTINPLNPLYDLSEILPPSQHVLFETTAWNSVHMTCAGNASRNAIEFHHVSSISAGRDDNYIVASRNLDTVWSLKRDGSGVQWTLSVHDEIPSDFTFQKPLDKFYQPHSVLQLDNGDLLMIDDGTDRPGCTVIRTGACFSRAVRYRLDHDLKTISIVWQFTYPYDLKDADNFLDIAQRDTWNEVGGSAFRLENGHYLVAFSSVDASAQNPRGSALIFELDIHGNHTLTTTLAIPTPTSNIGTQNGYRFMPWHSINGESFSTPFLQVPTPPVTPIFRRR